MKQNLIVFVFIFFTFIMGCSQEGSHIKRGLRQFDRGEYDAAIRSFNKAIEINPKSANAYYFRGLVYIETNDLNKAISDNTNAIILNATFTNAYINRGAILYENGNYEDAIKDLDQAIQLNPSDYKTFIARADNYYQLGQFGNAINDYTNALTLNSNSAYIYLMRADAFYKMKAYQEAINDYEKSIFLNDTLERAYNNYAFLLSTCPDDKYRNGKKALEIANKLITINRRPIFLDTLSIVYAELGDFKKAEEIISEAINLENNEENIAEYKERLKMYKQLKSYRE